MTYNVGQIIENETYNAFSASVNEVFADTHLVATTLPDAGFGYGQPPLPNLPSVPPEDPVPPNSGLVIFANEWELLFSAIRNCGVHQGTPGIVPPFPDDGPISGDIIKAITTEENFNSIITSLKVNKFNANPAQFNIIEDVIDSYSSTWLNTITFTYTYSFGEGLAGWQNARYFFNTGGSLQLSGTYEPNSPITPDEDTWAIALFKMSPLIFNATTTTPRLGGNDEPTPPDPPNPPPPGFYGLTNSEQTIYKKHVGDGEGPYYTVNFIEVKARLLDPPGTNGKIAFAIKLTDEDTFLEPKDGILTYSVKSYRSVTVPIIGKPGEYEGIAFLGTDNLDAVSNGFEPT